MYCNIWGMNTNRFMWGYTNPYMFGYSNMYANPFMMNSIMTPFVNPFTYNPYIMRFNFIQSIIGNMLNGFNQSCNCNQVQTKYQRPISVQPVQTGNVSAINNNASQNINSSSYSNTFENAYQSGYSAAASLSKTSKIFGQATIQSRISPNSTKTSSVNNSANGVKTDITAMYTGTADDLNKNLKGVLKGKGDVFLRAQSQYGVNAALLASICIHETGNGTSRLAKEQNNVGGIRHAGKTSFRHFDSVDDCIMYMASLLKRNYIGKGLTTIGSIGAKYCPTNDPTDKNGTNNQWAAIVSKYYQNYAVA